MIKKRYLLVLVITIIAVAILLLLLNWNKTKNLDNTYPAITIKRDDIEKEINSTTHYYSFQHQNFKDYPTLESDAKTRVIDNAIIRNFSDTHNIKATSNEVNERYAQKIQSDGEQKLLQRIYDMYKISKEDYLEILTMDILREKVQQSVGKSLPTWLEEQKNNLKVNIS